MTEKDSKFGAPLLTGMPLEQAQRIAAKMKRRKIAKNSKLAEEGKTIGKVFWVTQGNVAVQWVWEGKNRLTAFINSAPCLLGHLEAWTGEPSNVNLIAMDDLELLEIDDKAFLALVQTHHQIAINVAAYTGKMASENIRVQHQFLFGTASEIIARSIFFLIKIYGKIENGVSYLDNFSTRTQLALLSGISRRSVIEALKELETAGILQTSGRRLLLLNEKALRKRSGKLS